MHGPALILLAAAFTIAVSLGLGRLLLGGLGVKLCRGEDEPVSFVAGAACLSLLVFVLAALRWAYTGTFIGLGVAILALAAWRKAYRRPDSPLPPLDRSWRILFAVLFCIFAAVYLVNAMAPEASADGSAYHLGLVSRYHRAHGFEPVRTNIYAMLSQGVEMLFWFAFSMGGHSAAALVHLAFALALPLMMLAYARRFGMPAAGAAASLFVFVAPAAGIDGSVAYNDLALAAVVFALFHLLRVWETRPDWRLLVPIGLLAGFVYAIKYTAFLAVPYALARAAWRLRRDPRLVRAIAVIAACAALMMLPWIVKNTIVLGNPFAPFFNSVFPNPWVRVSFEQEYAMHMRHYEGLKSWAAIPLEVTLRGGVLCGLLGPLFLLSPAALAALRWPEGRRLLLAWAVFALTYLTNVGTRFLIPSLPFLALALALVFARIPRLLPAIVLAHAVLSFPPVVRLYADPHAWRLHSFPWRAALRLEPEEAWLRRNFPGYSVARLIEDKVAASGAVFSFNQVAEAYTSRRVLVAYESALGQLLGGILWTPVVPDYQPVKRFEFPVDTEPHRIVRVVQTAEAAPDQWNVTEMRVLLGRAEIPRSPAWRVRAWPNIWEAPLAFDNSPVTSWGCARPAAPLMSIEIDFGSPVKLDTVRLDCPLGQHRIRMRLETQDAEGRWSYQGAPAIETDAPPPPGLRRYVALEFLSRGVTHLLVQDTDFFADDFRRNAAEWRLAVEGELPGVRLYRFR